MLIQFLITLHSLSIQPQIRNSQANISSINYQDKNFVSLVDKLQMLFHDQNLTSSVINDNLCFTPLLNITEKITNISDIGAKLDNLNNEVVSTLEREIEQIDERNIYSYVKSNWNNIMDVLMPCNLYFGPAPSNQKIELSSKVRYEMEKLLIMEFLGYYIEDQVEMQSIYNTLSDSPQIDAAIFQVLSKFYIKDSTEISLKIQSSNCRSWFLNYLHSKSSIDWSANPSINVVQLLKEVGLTNLSLNLSFSEAHVIKTAINDSCKLQLEIFSIGFEENEINEYFGFPKQNQSATAVVDFVRNVVKARKVLGESGGDEPRIQDNSYSNDIEMLGNLTDSTDPKNEVFSNENFDTEALPSPTMDISFPKVSDVEIGIDEVQIDSLQ
eukprot:NODE_10_length_61504_cov_0.956502.p21 type:complete len:383 gc:universal NODE_10_length_61504_cov_0.956502:12026-13174(+)